MKCLLYISYDKSEYINYFHLAIDSEFIKIYVPIEGVNDLVAEIKKYCSVGDYIDLCICADKKATRWEDFETCFKNNGFKLSCTTEWNGSDICDFLSSKFDDCFYLNDSNNIIENQNKIITRIFSGSGQLCNESDDCNPQDEIQQERTGLAQIVLEKYRKAWENE